MRAFIFSMDAFVAFTLALLAVYSLVFFSSIPSGYYATLAQAHTLASDGLEAMQLTRCDSAVLPGCPDADANVSVLEYIALQNDVDPAGDARAILETLVPRAFGYRLEKKYADADWEAIYDSASDPLRPAQPQRLQVNAHALLFQYTDPFEPPTESPYDYRTCQGGLVTCGLPQSEFEPGTANTVVVRLTVYA